MNEENIVAADTLEENRAYFPVAEFLDIYNALFGAEFFTDLSSKSLGAGT